MNAQAASQVQAAVQALYHGPPDQQAAANAWLNTWAVQQDAWQAALAGLQTISASLEVRLRL